MKKRVVGLILTILLLFICLNAVNAENIILDDNSLTNLNSTDILNDTLSENSSHIHSELSKVLSDSPVKKSTINAPGGTFTQLQNIINGAGSGDTIEFTGDYTYDSGTDSSYKQGIYVSKSLTIVGNGYTIDGVGQARLFYVVADNVHITDLNLIRGYAATGTWWSYYTSGGGIYSQGNNLNVTFCNFSDNYASV